MGSKLTIILVDCDKDSFKYKRSDNGETLRVEDIAFLQSPPVFFIRTMDGTYLPEGFETAPKEANAVCLSKESIRQWQKSFPGEYDDLYAGSYCHLQERKGLNENQ